MNHNNDSLEYMETDPWDRDTYRTGSTKPPKNHRGLIGVLLVVIICLCGFISIMGIMNVKMFRSMQDKATDNTLPIYFSKTEEPEAPVSIKDPTFSTEIPNNGETNEITIAPSPSSVENILQEGGLSLQEIYRRTIGSVVSITAYYGAGASTGTGLIMDEAGYIVTNFHVVEDAQSIHILLSDGRDFAATLVGSDEISDLAVLFIEADQLQAATFGDSSVLQVGDSVVAIGDPLGSELRGTMTNGIISAINRDVDVDGRTMNLIQTNAALNSGNSGGPLINCYGQVVGINTMKMGDTMSIAGVEGLGFAIPSTIVCDIVNQLIGQGYVSGRPTLGISGEPVTTLYQFYYRLPKGLFISEIDKNSAASQAGLEIGDILISLDDQTVASNNDLKNILYNYKPGDTIKAVIFRKGKQYQVTLTVDEAIG